MNSTNLTSIRWPAVIWHRDDPELVYIKDGKQWNSDPDLAEWRYDERDRLVDSNGECFALAFDQASNRCSIEPTGKIIDLQEFSSLIQQHMFALAQTCVSKVECRSYEDGFRSLEMLEH